MLQPRAFLQSLFEAAIAAADPVQCVPPNLPEPPQGRTIVIGAGKAAASMAWVRKDGWAIYLVLSSQGMAMPC